MRISHYLFAALALLVSVAIFYHWDAPALSTADREQGISSQSQSPEHDRAADSSDSQEMIPVVAEAPLSGHPEGCGCPLHEPAAAKPARQADKIMALPEPTRFLESILSADHKVASIPLPNGRMATGNVTVTQDNKDGVWLVQGTMDEPEAGRFMFMRQTIEGVAGEMVGFVLYDESDVAYKVLPEGNDGGPVLAEVSADEVVCRGYEARPNEDTEEPLHLPQTHPRTYPIPPDENYIIQLQSLPEAEGVIYLDFDGEERDFIGWGYINALPTGISNGQIFSIWQGVSEDFQPFNLNVTTVRSVYDNAPRGQRIHVVVTPTTDAAPGAGGVAFLDSFNWDSDPVCWSFAIAGKDAVEVISHEVGHTLGLLHHGRTEPPEEYYLGASGWAPIMGAGYYQPVTHWSKGEYTNANNSAQDDLRVITTVNNGLAYRTDDHGGTYATASYLEISEGGEALNEGTIERSSDQDGFRFSTAGGRVKLDIKGVNFTPNLDIGVQLVEEDGTVIFTNAPDNSRTAVIDRTVPAGDYYALVYGTGKGTLATNGYTDYGSLGGYTITGTVQGGVHSDRFMIDENSPNGSLVGTVPTRANHGAGVISYSISSGNANGAFVIDPDTGTITVADSSLLDYEALSTRWDDPANIELFISVTDSLSVATESIRTVVTVLDVNESPVIEPLAAITIPENLEIGTKLVTVKTKDPDRFDFADFAIVGGNPGGAFTINSLGEIIVAGALIHENQASYSLVIETNDQFTPVRSDTTGLEINLVAIQGGYATGSIMRNVYADIPGTEVVDLTSDPTFPDEISSKELLSSFDAGLNRDLLYGSTIRGYLIAPRTGDYSFWIASNDASELWISTDASPDNAVLQARVTTRTEPYEWSADPSQQSASLSLVEGQAYYIESRHKADVGEDHVAVAWSGPDIDQEVIPGTWLAPYDPEGVPEIMIASPNEESVDLPENVGLMLECVAIGPNGSIPIISWTQVDGPEGVVFSSPDQRQTSAVFPQKGSYVVRVSATDGVNTATDEIIVRTGSTVGSGLIHTRYGEATTGTYQMNGDTGYTITGASIGIPLIDDDDGFQLLGQVFNGDFDLMTRVASGTNVAANHERMGLVVRKGVDAVSDGVSAYIGYRTSTTWGHFIRRQNPGEANKQNSYVNTGVPGWTRIARTGNTVRAYHSYNGGQTWVNRGAINIKGPVRAGLCWSSSDKAQTGSAVFDNLQGFAPGNLAPLVDAGVDATVEASTSITLYGSASDDGLPIAGGGLKTRWTRVSGPGQMTFSNPDALDTDVICNTAGAHVIRLAVDDGGAITFDEMLLTVTEPEIMLAFSTPVLAGFSAPAGTSYDGYTLADQITVGATSNDPGTTDGLAGSNPGDEFVFTKVSGPAWLEITADGQLTGEPRLGDSGKNSFVVQVANAKGQSDQATLEIDVTLTAWQSWRIEKFGAEAENPEVFGDLIDGDRDGYVNLMEYALATAPDKPDVPEIVHDLVQIDGVSYLRLAVTRNFAADDVSYHVQVTSTPSDPESWTSEGTKIEKNTTDQLIVRDTVAGTSRFIRLQVNRNN